MTRSLSGLSRPTKQLIQLLIDIVSVIVSLWLAYSLRFNEMFPRQLADAGWLFAVTPLAGSVIFHRLGVYNIVIRGMTKRSLLSVFYGIAALFLLLIVVAFFVPEITIPRSVPFIFAMALLGLMIGCRALEQSLLLGWGTETSAKTGVAIYGAGTAGQHLASALDRGGQFAIRVFLDDDPTLHGKSVAGRPVVRPSLLPLIVKKENISRVFIAIPSLPPDRRREIVKAVSAVGLPIQTVPSVGEIVAGLATIDQLRAVSPDDFLGRARVPAQRDLLEKAVAGKSVLVTGAGGSIGSELCRQILAVGPKRLVLLERNEPALFEIDEELRHLRQSQDAPVDLCPILGSITDAERVQGIFRRFPIDVVFHAAAYKHVPLVELNPLEALRNNVLGTKIVARIAAEHGVAHFVLVSTDKAVRPTSLMGATKRLAELIAIARSRRSTTRFIVVRFGNVLGSSGSIIPVFQRQIKRGGPVTVTHPEATRFFMTIPEAAQLLVQAAGLDELAGTFILDMGAPISIDWLARRMITLAGLRVREAGADDGDIEIRYIGLRPGEKLHEELSYSGSLRPTVHPKILCSDEGLDEIDWADLERLFDALTANDLDEAVRIARVLVGSFRPSEQLATQLGPRPPGRAGAPTTPPPGDAGRGAEPKTRKRQSAL